MELKLQFFTFHLVDNSTFSMANNEEHMDRNECNINETGASDCQLFDGRIFIYSLFAALIGLQL